MALRTDSRKAKENVRQYILNNVDFSGYVVSFVLFGKEKENFPTIAHSVLDIFRSEKSWAFVLGYNEFCIFLDWTRGLPFALDCCFWYNRSAVDDLGAILEETEEEKAKYNEEEAGLLLVKLIYRELVKGESEYMNR